MLAARLKFVTGSDSAVICGLSPFKTKLQLWQEKTGRVVAEDIGHLSHIKFGNFFERGVADWFEADSGKKIDFDNPLQGKLLVHPSIGFMAGTLDYRILNENAILECKTALSDDAWGESGTDAIPPYYLMQVAHYCAVGNFDRAYIAVVFAQKREMRWYVYDRNLELETKLIARERDFWEKHVLADVCPEPVNAKDVMALYKETSAIPVIATKDILSKVRELVQLQADVTAANDNVEALKEQIQLHMLDADTLIDEFGNKLATWKFSKPVSSNNLKKLETEFPEVYAACRIKNDPRRSFVTNKRK